MIYDRQIVKICQSPYFLFHIAYFVTEISLKGPGLHGVFERGHPSFLFGKLIIRILLFFSMIEVKEEDVT